ncbi:MAG: hypothetical protein H7062_12000, partial [Candidatus Saccharimonas sp.]|nr:hypothetical protein [Planctomycetaceae bacterium]
MTDRIRKVAIAMSPQCRWMTGVVAALLVSGLSLLAQEKPADKSTAPVGESEEVKFSREQLRLSLEQVELFRLQHAESGAEIERIANPVLRFTAPLLGGHHGTVWVWGKRGRPVAVLEMFRDADVTSWNQAFHATTDDSIKLTMPAGKTWTPKSSNLKFQPLPDAPPPADTPAGRI